jgi:uncharacterized membrane protein
MKSRIISWWEDLRESFWFIPSVMLIGAFVLSIGTVALDHRFDDELLKERQWVFALSAEGSRTLLSTVAGSMMTIAGVIFSITILTLTMASNQFGPRLLKNFRRSAGNQIVLGTFIATFTYSILVLRTVGTEGEESFVPHLSIMVSVVFAILSMALLIYFIHHTAVLLQASSIVQAVYRDLYQAVDRLYPEHEGEGSRMRREKPGCRRILRNADGLLGQWRVVSFKLWISTGWRNGPRRRGLRFVSSAVRVASPRREGARVGV